MTHNVYLYILGMWLVSYLIRVLPLTLIRRQITNRTIRSFLYYVPYVTLAVMTFPAILSATQSPISGERPSHSPAYRPFSPRKSGMPLAVENPAPVKQTTRFEASSIF